jgi:hypothetical protein
MLLNIVLQLQDPNPHYFDNPDKLIASGSASWPPERD